MTAKHGDEQGSNALIFPGPLTLKVWELQLSAGRPLEVIGQRRLWSVKSQLRDSLSEEVALSKGVFLGFANA